MIRRAEFCSLAAAALLALAAPAYAADPVFPIGSLVGMVPPPGMEVSKTFMGFVDAAKDSAILLAAEPPADLAELEKTLSTDTLKKQSITVDKREDIQLGFGKATLVIGKQEDNKKRYRKWLVVAPAKDLTALVNIQVPENETAYPDAVLRMALSTLAIRTSIPDAEQLSTLPFTVGDHANFHVQTVVPGRVLVLSDPPDAASPDKLQPHMLVAAFPGGPTEPDGYAEFARLAFDQIGGIKDVTLTMSEPLRIGGQPGFQTVAQAKDTRSGADVMVAQWLRFGGGGYFQMIGVARKDGWPDALTRMRAVRDSVEPR